MVAFEINLDAVPQPKSSKTSRPALNASDLQAVSRDFAFIVDNDVAAEQIVRAARGADKSLIASVSVFDVFAGQAIGEGRKSVAVDVILQPREKTLTDEDIEAVSQKIVGAVEKATGGRLRG